ncbi:MAG: hypothetical protein K0S44_241 [Bacteroidetes bacterium]|jgi:hypothetical protein|nr:hypothetical protein [Bacteroidota bacterium]
MVAKFEKFQNKRELAEWVTKRFQYSKSNIICIDDLTVWYWG